MAEPKRGGNTSRRASPIDEAIGHRVRARRLGLGVTAAEMAAALRVSPARLQAIENGSVPLQAQWLTAAGEVLRVPVSFFFDGLVSASCGPDPGGLDRPQRPVWLPPAKPAPPPDVTADPERRTLRLGRAGGFGYLPLYVMEAYELVEHHLRAAGLRQIAVEYVSSPLSAVINDALLRGRIQIAGGGIAPFLSLWDGTRDTLAIHALRALAIVPQYLVTRRRGIRTLADFGEHDRINVYAPNWAVQAIVLQMAAAQVFGEENFARLDHLMVGLSPSDSVSALLSKNGIITADFAPPPFVYQEIETPGARVVLSTEDVLGGPTTTNLLYTTGAFERDHPELVRAALNAFDEAICLIAKDRRVAAEAFLKVERRYPFELNRMVEDTRLQFSIHPSGIMKYAQFMHRTTRTLKSSPSHWAELFFPAAAAQLRCN